MLAWLTAAGGVVVLIAALLPRSTLAAGLGWLAPHAASRAAHVLLVPVGMLLVITSRGLLRRNRRAWLIAVIAAGSAALLQLLGGSVYLSTVLACLLTIALAANREAFPFRGDPAARPSAWRRLVGMLLVALGYGMAAFWAYRWAAGQSFRLGPALVDTLRAMGGQLPRDIDFLPGEFADWYPLSVLSILTMGVIWAVAAWLRPWKQRLRPDADRRREAGQIVRQWGTDTLAPFALRSDKEWFMTGQTLIAYRVVRGVALVSGDPVGPPESDGDALDSFLSYARARGWRTAILGTSERLASTYRSRGLVPVYHGDEAVIDTADFSLDGRPMRAVRQAVHRLQRGSYHADVIAAGDVPGALREELIAVERAWLRGRPRTGFSMELDSLFRLGGEDALFVVGRDPQGCVSGFLHLAVCRAGGSLSLSTMPRLAEVPNGFTSWLIVEAVSWARDHGYSFLSLNFSPFASLLAGDGQLAARQRLQRRALFRVKQLLDLQLDNLLRFNEQFGPLRQPRFIVLEARPDLPRVALAAMAAEGYLPFAGLVRGRGWSVPDALPDGQPAGGDLPSGAGLPTAGAGRRRWLRRHRPAAGLQIANQTRHGHEPRDRPASRAGLHRRAELRLLPPAHGIRAVADPRTAPSASVAGVAVQQLAVAGRVRHRTWRLGAVHRRAALRTAVAGTGHLGRRRRPARTARAPWRRSGVAARPRRRDLSRSLAWCYWACRCRCPCPGRAEPGLRGRNRWPGR